MILEWPISSTTTSETLIKNRRYQHSYTVAQAAAE